MTPVAHGFEREVEMTMGEEFFEAGPPPAGGKMWVPNAIVYKDGVWSFSPEYEALLEAARDLDVEVELYDEGHRVEPEDAPAILAAFALCGIAGAIVASVIWTVVLWLT